MSGKSFANAEDYIRNSQMQELQGERLLKMVRVNPGDKVLDIGCGFGRLTIRLLELSPNAAVKGIDSSPQMIEAAKEHARRSGVTGVEFTVMDLLDMDTETEYDLVVSSSAMHWITPPDKAYASVYRALKTGGRMAIHQGGRGSYRGMHHCAVKVISEMGLERYFLDWEYPTYYPGAAELQRLLVDTGFENVKVVDVEYDGSEFSNLPLDFAVAALPPYSDRIPETERDRFKELFINAASVPGVSGYTHRLFALATKGQKER